MSAYLSWKYLDQLFLPGYKRRGSYLANFSCVICNESSMSRHAHKKRAYLIEKNGEVFYYCHRCGASMSAWKFLERTDSSLYKEYRLETLRESGVPRRRMKPEPDFSVSFSPKCHARVELPSICALEDDHFARRYVEGRRIPSRFWGRIHFAADFRVWVNSLVPGKFDVSAPDPRIVFPFYDGGGDLHAVQGRSLRSDGVRYVLITLDEATPSVYGLGTVDWDLPVLCTEGPIDSLFLPNSIASVGGDVTSKIRDLPKKNVVIVFDNERRSPHMKHKMKKAIDEGYRVVIWPNSIKQKDVNEMILSGATSDEIVEVVNSNVYGGESDCEKIGATLELEQRFRC